MPAACQVQRIAIPCDLFYILQSPFKECPPPGRFQRQLVVARSGFSTVRGGCAEEVPVNLRVCFERWVKKSEFAEHLALPCCRTRGECAVPVRNRARLRFLVIVSAEVHAEQNVH